VLAWLPITFSVDVIVIEIIYVVNLINLFGIHVQYIFRKVTDEVRYKCLSAMGCLRNQCKTFD